MTQLPKEWIICKSTYCLELRHLKWSVLHLFVIIYCILLIWHIAVVLWRSKSQRYINSVTAPFRQFVSAEAALCCSVLSYCCSNRPLLFWPDQNYFFVPWYIAYKKSGMLFWLQLTIFRLLCSVVNTCTLKSVSVMIM